MPEPVRVLIVDDSSVVRRAVSEALSRDCEIDVVGTASNGRIALQRISQLRPEVLILDIDMPESDGFEVLRTLREQGTKVRTIMFSTLTQRGASQTIEALSLGASDYATKPSAIGQQEYTVVLDRVASELLPKIKQFRGGAAHFQYPSPEGFPRKLKMSAMPMVVAIGLSTGGPEALSACLPRLPQFFPLPILIVQHMPPIFTRLLSDRLNDNCRIKVVEAAEGMTVEPSTAYIAQGNYHMTVRQEKEKVVLVLNQDPPENSCRPAVDVLLRSVAQVYGPQALGVIMTGMGQDGLIGIRAMKERGAAVIAQDEASSVVWGMPSFVVREGLADWVLPLDQIAAAVDTYVMKGAVSIT